jgi:lysyl-tRNA synthetase class 2
LSQTCPTPYPDPIMTHSHQATYPSFISCFPQMKPEAPARAVELTEDEKLVLNLLKANSPMDLNELKEQTGLSNKKWDKAIKGLTKTKLARVEKTEEGLVVSLA